MYKKYEELLRKTGKTSYQVSRDTGIGENILSYWKNGRSKPKTDKLKILADYFGVSINYFLDETPEGANRQDISLSKRISGQYGNSNIDGGVLAKFDADGNYLDENMNFTFEDFSMPESFAAMNGFITN